MAVSGRKEADLLDSIAAGSAEDFDNKCDPCQTEGQYIEAHGFCIQCQEYLCKTCYDCHRKTRFSRSHTILEKDEFDKVHIAGPYKECSEECPLHLKEIITFYCPTHSTLGCNDCMTIAHRACKIDYIPDKCSGLANGKEYHDIMMELGKKLKEAEEVSKMAEGSRRDINYISKEIIKTVAEFREEINNRLDQMQRDIVNKVESKTSCNLKIVKKVIDTCGNIISDVKNLHSSLRTSKTNNRNGQLYIDMKRAESALKSEKLTEAKESLLDMNSHYTFCRSSGLEKMFSKEKVFGEILSQPRFESTKMKTTIDHLALIDDINVKTTSDKGGCCITGCVVLPSSKLVLADYFNKKIKVVSIENKIVQAEKNIDSEPFDIAVISQDLVAVTVPGKTRIDIIKADDNLSFVRSINVKGNCSGIDCHQDRIYVVCLEPSRIVVVTSHGKFLNYIPLNFRSSEYFTYIAVRKDFNFLYISAYVNKIIVSVSLQGDVQGECVC